MRESVDGEDMDGYYCFFDRCDYCGDELRYSGIVDDRWGVQGSANEGDNRGFGGMAM